MSSRQMKQMLRQSLEAEQEARFSESEEEHLVEERPSKAFNPFDLLAADDEAGSASDDEDAEHDDNKAPEPDMEEKIAKTDQSTDIESSSSKKKKKKKKKTKKKGSKGGQNATSASHEAGKQQGEDSDNEDIDKVIREVRQQFGEEDTGTSSAAAPDAGGAFAFGHGTMPASATSGLLTIDRKALNADLEMQRKFHVQIARAEGRRAQMRRGGGRGRTMRTTTIVNAKAGWPVLGRSGLRMVVDESANTAAVPGTTPFMLTHGSSYQEAEVRFLRALRTFDPEAIATVLRQYPFHVNSLLQLSEVCRISGDVQMAADLVERAVYVLELSFHPLFLSCAASGQARLSYTRHENRCLFLALFHHTGFIANKGCWNAALECSKMLFALDPEHDPLAALLLLDYYALRAEQYTYLIRLCEEWEHTRRLSYLPSFAYSHSMACFFHSLDLAEQPNSDKAAARQRDRADALLRQAVIRFPAVPLVLAESLSASLHPRLVSHPHFARTVSSNPNEKGLMLLIKAFVHRCNSLWKAENVLSWLQGVCLKLIDDYEDPTVKLECDAWVSRRAALYSGVPRNIQRHVLLSNIDGVISYLPAETTSTSVEAYDPLPPPESGPWPYLDRLEPQVEVNYSGGALGAFLQSLLPGFNAEAEAAEAQRQRRVLPPAFEAGAGLRDQLVNMVDFLRQSLGHRGTGEQGQDEFEYTAEELEALGLNDEDHDDHDDTGEGAAPATEAE